MKVFLAKNKYEELASREDILIVAKTRKEAKLFFDDEIKETLGITYLSKDFKELEVKNIIVKGLGISSYLKNDDISSVFEVYLEITLKNYIEYCEYKIVETEETYRELINMFKKQNPNLIKTYF